MRQTFPAGGLAALLVIGACASGGATKGGLVPLAVTRSELDQAQAGRRLALVVGVNRFDDPSWRELRFAAKDAEDMAGVLGDPSRGGFQVIRRNTLADTSKAAILEALDELSALDDRPDDVVVVYLSMHGTLSRAATHGPMQRYLVARDTRMAAVADTGISLDDLQARLDRLASRRKVLILATCHSGAGKSLLPPGVLAELEGTKGSFFSRPLEDASRASIVLAACDWGETAREDEGLANDIYTHFLVEALRLPADRNGDGAVTATEAHDYARRKTFEFTQGQQRPSAELVEVGADPVILSGAVMRPGRPEIFGYSSALDGATLTVDQEEPLDLPGARVVAAGPHRIQITKGGADLFAGDVDLAEGARIDASELMVSTRHTFQLEVEGGYQGFLDPNAVAGLGTPTAAAQAAITFPDLVARHLAARASFSASWGARDVEVGTSSNTPQPFRYLGLQAGIAVPYQRMVGPIELEAGPLLTAVYVDRSFAPSIYSTPQQYLTLSPGLGVGAGYAINDHWMLVARATGSAELVSVDGQSQAAGFGSLWVGVGFGL